MSTTYNVQAVTPQKAVQLFKKERAIPADPRYKKLGDIREGDIPLCLTGLRILMYKGRGLWYVVTYSDPKMHAVHAVSQFLDILRHKAGLQSTLHGQLMQTIVPPLLKEVPCHGL